MSPIYWTSTRVVLRQMKQLPNGTCLPHKCGYRSLLCVGSIGHGPELVQRPVELGP